MSSAFSSARAMVVLWALLGATCGHESSIPIVPTAASSSEPTVTLTGTVVDYTGAPVPGARVCAFPLTGWTAAWSRSSSCTDRSATDASGRYILDLPEHRDVVYVTAWKDGYFQQCAVGVVLASDTSVDLSITTEAVITGLPVTPDLRHVSGVVYEITEGGKRPVQSASVGWEPDYFGSTAAHTRTDEEGGYRLCGLPREGMYLALYASWGRGYVHKVVAPGGDAVVDFELHP